MTDPENCGGCGTVCASNETCAAGVCKLNCQAGRVPCAGSCINTTNDPNNCGGCGKACPDGWGCVSSSCTLVCSGALLKCGTVCVDVQSDSLNCGGYGLPCAADELCSGGSCAPKEPLVDLASWGDQTCARWQSGALKCWGRNDAGQLGLGDTNNRGDEASEMGVALPALDLVP